jgi:preprotein translocase subunit SecG
MEKATWTLGTTIVVLILLSIILTGKPSQPAPTMPTPVKTEAPVKTPTNNAPATQAPATK